MTSTTITLHGQNKMTMPISFCRKFPTKHYLAIDRGKELVIKPILEENIDNDLTDFFLALNDSAKGMVIKHKSPQEYLKKIKNA